MSVTVFIYGLNCPLTGKCRYVGKAINPQKRFARHLWEAPKIKSHKNRWICSLLGRRLQPVLEILDSVLSETADEMEREYIRVFRAIGLNLTNQTDGGDGTFGLAPWNKGLSLPKPSRSQTRVRNWSHLNRLHAGNVGKKRSVEAKQNMSLAQRKLVKIREGSMK